MIIVLIAGVLAACDQDNGSVTSDDAQTADSEEEEYEVSEDEIEQFEDEQDTHYAFEFEDIDGNIHKLSDYEGQCVFIEVWSTTCGVCTSSLEELNDFAAETDDFVVLSVVTPSYYGEKNKKEFIEWYEKLGYNDLPVLLDEKSQLVNDFNVRGWPTLLFFDEAGNFAKQMAGQMSGEMITLFIDSISQK